MTAWDECLEAATSTGHTAEQASQCKGCELECLFCPFDDDGGPKLQQSDLRFPLGHWDNLGMPED